jgi:hypothetical protein
VVTVGFLDNVADKGIEVLLCAATFFKGRAAANRAKQAQAVTRHSNHVALIDTCTLSIQAPQSTRALDRISQNTQWFLIENAGGFLVSAQPFQASQTEFICNCQRGV